MTINDCSPLDHRPRLGLFNFSTSTSSTDVKVAQLVPQLVTDENVPELTTCISTLAELKYTNDDLLETLIQNSPWKATFAMAPNKQGRFLPFGELTIEQDTIQQFIDLNVCKFCFQGNYYMSGMGNKMNIEFTSLDICFLGWDLPTLDISNDSMIVRYARGGGGAGRKRPNTYLWHFVNEEICVARGSSGKVAMWQSKKSNEE
ncbi:predicted protein [Chaetoceros tenuissimus]|uniref:Uncharacterized protein n=1 Tax=Chaetoceros tenuissimus TaxID=426638 RepID=A0AAD3CUU2_9STRA|nr:predicted protein [Chaetoceros tenuissimus]